MWKRIGVIVLFIGVIGLAIFSKSRLKWNENVADMLPQSSEFADYTELIKIFRPDNKAFFLVKKSAAVIPGETLIKAADDLAAGLEKAQKDNVKIFSRVIYRQDIDPMESIDFYLDRQGCCFDETTADIISGRLDNEWLNERFAGIRKQFYESPVPGLLQIVSKDPLDLSGARFTALQSLLPTQGKVTLHRGRLFSEDLQSILVIAETAVDGTDISHARNLVAYVNQVLDNTREKNAGIEVAWMAGQRFSVENADIIRSDVTRIFIISSVLILLMVWLTLRQIGSVMVLVLPWIFGFSLAFIAVSLTHSSVSVIGLGMASILAGITVDYGIYILCFGREFGSARKAAVELRYPLFIAVITTVIAFGALILSGITVLQQLGEIASYWVVGSAAFALFCLPPLLSWFALIKKNHFNPHIGWGQRKLLELPAKKQLMLLVLFSLLLLPGLGLLRIEDDLQNFNAVSKITRSDFDEIGELIAINQKTLYVAVHGNDFQHVLEQNWNLASELNKMAKNGMINKFSSIAGLIPPHSRQEKNIARWKNYWDTDRKNRLTTVLEKAASLSGMRFPIFRPYLEQVGAGSAGWIKNDNLPSSLKQLVNEHMRTYKGKSYILTRIEPSDNCDIVTMTAHLRTSISGLIAADMGLLRYSTMKVFINGLLTLSGIVFVLITVFLILFTRDIRRSLAIMLPLLLAFFWTFGLLGWLHVKIDASSSIVCVILFGVMIDYSIYITNSIKKRTAFGALPTAITLSLFSTILGFGSLIMANHPVIHACGIATLTTTFCGWLAVSLSSFIYTPSARKK